VTYCQKGQRGYLAACALHGHGFEDVANLRGGFLQAQLLHETQKEQHLQNG
jgi:rhodanese-related sulfurtransferase